MKLRSTLGLVALILFSCATAPPEKELSQAEDESQKANAMFEEFFMESVLRNPVWQTYLGIKQDYDKWTDLSDAYAEESLQITKNQLQKLKQEIDYAALDEASKLSYRLFVEQSENSIADHKWRYHDYPVNQMFGTHSMVPSLLINQHQIASVEDAEAYISRLNGVSPMFDQLTESLEKRAQLGIMAPKFVYPYTISDSKNIISGAPFGEGSDSTLLADFKRKLEALDATAEDKQRLRLAAEKALLSSVGPAYEKLIAKLEQLEGRADTRDGAWKLPDGEAFYNNALQRTTTTALNAAEIHQLGLDEVARIHQEMHAIMKKVDFKGDLQQFFTFMRTDPQFYLPDTEEGKQQYLSDAKGIIDEMKGRIHEVFQVEPKASLTVKRVEAFREKSAGKAFYQRPSMDGSRPGLYYANLHNMKNMPIYEMEALAYHEGIPGHHMQIAIAQELVGIPKFRKFGGYTAYIEGWGLYSEYLPKEMGFYEDPYSDFGRLAMELWRACRLVVDTGIHAKKWTREQAIDYLVENSPNARTDSVRAIERYIVMPSQATAYKIGMLKILELREEAKAKLADKFDIREFHDIVLKNGAVPLNVLESMVADWVSKKS